MLLVRVVISVLCAVGFYASVFMLRKSILNQRGMLPEPSVVQSPRAALLRGVPNACIGLLYYAALPVAAWLGRSVPVFILALAAACAAAAMSVYLAYSLLFVTKRNCPYCFLSHAINVALVPACARLLVLH